ncbi:MAG TPA: 5-formyltetrahydrofolate cyclo-ligase [Candidatus Omnitrophota bacterium]|nr:5-formyltetrahydrofolate cyclo-ligase [Candidatus Omnitrophota bacterium]HPS37014.1 5-formyltetrahydrofolate cyclo-ligase [Candidatus Omnitrophota bacterium]
MPEKTSLRRSLQEKRSGISALRRKKKSRRIFEKLFRLPGFGKAEHVALYYSLPGEVDTRPFLKKLFCEKKIYLPRVNPRKKDMRFFRVGSLSDLRKGAYAIMEPRKSCPGRGASKMDLIVVPGVAFDRRGGRLGRGGGYYDRILRRAGKVPVIGVCFREQLVKKVPMTLRDVRVDRVITD